MHKNYDKPHDPLYLPLQVGASLSKDKFLEATDDKGDNISNKNKNFCELTGIYYAWKNLDYDNLGLVHYRRYFKGNLKATFNNKTKKILSNDEVEKYLQNCDVIVPKKRNYYIENLYSHYEHTMYIEPLIETGKILQEKYPEYSFEFERLKKRKSAHMFNMFVASKKFCDKYFNFLFDVLFTLEKRVDATIYSDFHARFFGRISELLFDVFLYTNNIKFKEVKVVDIEKINWFKKIKSFLVAKFKKKKYEKSF